MRIPEDTERRPPGPLITSHYKQDKCGQIAISAIAATRQVRKPDAQIVTGSRALNGMTPVKLAA